MFASCARMHVHHHVDCSHFDPIWNETAWQTLNGSPHLRKRDFGVPSRPSITGPKAFWPVLSLLKWALFNPVVLVFPTRLTLLLFFFPFCLMGWYSTKCDAKIGRRTRCLFSKPTKMSSCYTTNKCTKQSLFVQGVPPYPLSWWLNRGDKVIY